MTLAVRGLRFTYPGWPPTLDGVDLDVPAGESVFLLGPSGSGKSTLLRCLAGLEAGSGSVAWDGEDLSALPTHRRSIGLVFQDGALFPHLPAWRNVAFGLRYRGVAKGGERAEALDWLQKVNLEQ
jgi:thiamine transport system ATP-binding protein